MNFWQFAHEHVFAASFMVFVAAMVIDSCIANVASVFK